MRKSRIDGWQNFFSGIGRKNDKTTQNTWGSDIILDDDMLTSIWMGDGLATKIVNAPADDAIKNWISISGDDKGVVENEIKRLKLKKLFRNAMKWTRLYRGCLMVIGYEDGLPLSSPRRSTPRPIKWIKLYPAPQVPVSTTDIDIDPKSYNFGEIESFPVNPVNGGTFKVHHTRTIVFKGDGIPVSSNIDFTYRYWGMSALQPVFERLKNFGVTERGISGIMQEVVVGKYKISNLAEILSSNDKNSLDAIYNRLEIINYSKGLINAILLGEGEEWSRDTVNLSGVSDLLREFMVMLTGTSNIPMTRLFGISPGGLNSTGESDLRIYYDFVESEQEEKIYHQLDEIINIISLYLGVEINWKFNNIWSPSQSEEIEMRHKQAQTDKIYMETGVLDSETIEQSRFGGESYSFETALPE
jgi:uncharacterized protein